MLILCAHLRNQFKQGGGSYINVNVESTKILYISNRMQTVFTLVEVLVDFCRIWLKKKKT